MKVKIVLEKKDLEKMNTRNLINALKYFNNDRTEAHFKRFGDDFIEIIISKKEVLKNICKDFQIKHFETREEYLKWMRDKNKRQTSNL